MYKLLFDSDALIKASKAEFLGKIAENFNISITEDVYNETVKEGKKGFYQDADKIENFVNVGRIRVISKRHYKEKKLPEKNFGEGEKSTFQAHKKGSLIVSDDLSFTSYIKKEDIKSLSSAHLIYVLVKKKKLSKGDAHYCLEKLRPYIRKEVYKSVKTDIGE